MASAMSLRWRRLALGLAASSPRGGSRTSSSCRNGCHSVCQVHDDFLEPALDLCREVPQGLALLASVFAHESGHVDGPADAHPDGAAEALLAFVFSPSG